MVFAMVGIGGITRLTESGLSMVDWKLLMDAIPPMNESDWEIKFNEYKQFPEYNELNKHFSLSEFKSIFWWEFIHRFFGRLIGVVFILPFLFFVFKGWINKNVGLQLSVLLMLGAFQAFIGWYMVKSGLINVPRVSHFRLALHLITAFITFGYTLWLALNFYYKHKETALQASKKIKTMLLFFLLLLSIQILYGAFVAGKDAGLVHNHFPKMESGQWIADAAFAIEPLYLNFIESKSGIQFIHRYLAYIVFFFACFIWYKARSISVKPSLSFGVNMIMLMVSVQFILGVLTLLYHVPISLGVLHQLGALALFGGAVFSLHRAV